VTESNSEIEEEDEDEDKDVEEDESDILYVVMRVPRLYVLVEDSWVPWL